MSIIPTDPEAIRDDTPLARYIRGHPDRIAVLNRVLSLLDEDGRVGDAARYYAIKNPLRRSILRGVLIAEAIKVPVGCTKAKRLHWLTANLVKLTGATAAMLPHNPFLAR